MAGSGTAHLRPADASILRVEDLNVEFTAGRKGTVSAVAGVSLDVLRCETLGIVGESGCGKSTTGRAIMQLPRPTSGSVRFNDVELTTLSGRQLRSNRSAMQMILQDPIGSLNPRRPIRRILLEALAIAQRTGRQGPTDDPDALVDLLLSQVGLDPAAVGMRKPHQFSGGQCQRVCIARALILSPSLVICDEPVSALDVSVQAQILNLLHDLKDEHDLSLVFIAHDLAAIKNVADRVMVMYLGKLCEVGDTDTLFATPRHPYTQMLLEAVPTPDPDAEISPGSITGDLPSPVDPPSGCRFRTRCPRATELCAAEEPVLRAMDDGQFVACHHPLSVSSP